MYTITVANTGGSALNGVHVNDPLLINLDLSSDNYTATQSGGATGFTASGSGDINDTVNLPPHSSVTYTVDTGASCSARGGGSIVNTVTATSSLASVSATDTDRVGTNEC